YAAIQALKAWREPSTDEETLNGEDQYNEAPLIGKPRISHLYTHGIRRVTLGGTIILLAELASRVLGISRNMNNTITLTFVFIFVLIVVINIIGRYAVKSGALLANRARRIDISETSASFLHDPCPPILYLRSFRDDAISALPAGTFQWRSLWTAMADTIR